MTRHALVFGATGQIGVGVLPRLRALGIVVDAITRGDAPTSDDALLRWHRADLFADVATPPATDLVFGLGPLDGFVHWLERVSQAPRRVVVFGSTSAATKRTSPDAHERALAARLQTLEARLAQICDARGTVWTLLRPTLIYGLARDGNLTRIVRLARRAGVFVLPSGAHGLRQPVHADDLAAAAVQAALTDAGAGRVYDLAGGDTMRYDEMVRRTLACLSPRPRLVVLPMPLLRAALALAVRTGRLSGAGAGTLARMREDLVFDHADAVRDLGYSPRVFAPQASMFDAA